MDPRVATVSRMIDSQEFDSILVAVGNDIVNA